MYTPDWSPVLGLHITPAFFSTDYDLKDRNEEIPSHYTLTNS